jgi:tRNA (Thr-GGU) A37 N-methylase
MTSVQYEPIGYIRAAESNLLRPEIMRQKPATLVLEAPFQPAIKALYVGQWIWVMYHMHKIEAWDGSEPVRWLEHRIPRRPNPIALTLVKITGLQDGQITVEGLDAADGSPLIDIKPYRNTYDVPVE